MEVVFFDDEFQDLPGISPLPAMLLKLVAPGSDAPSPFNASYNSTWVLGSVTASYQRASFLRLNHFVPLFRRGEEGEELWNKISSESRNRLSKKIQQFAATVAEDDEIADEFSLSMRDHLHKLESQQEFMRLMHQLGFHPAVVPADGNCALWSVLTLQGGLVAKAQLQTMQDVSDLRQDACKCLARFVH